MYLLNIILLLIVLPVFSMLIDYSLHAPPLLALLGKWFVFWGVGVRLFLAGSRQLFEPRYTTQEIFGFSGDEAPVIVRELGIANIALGVIAILSVFEESFRLPVAIAGTLFFGISGIRHLTDRGRNAKHNTAMISDLVLAVILGVYLASALPAYFSAS